MSGLDPKLRPVNKSALLWKAATQVAIMHPEYYRASAAMQPLQLGLGAKFGMTRMAMTAQDYYAQGYSIGEADAENGFNRASRKAMLEAMFRQCPHMARLFWMGYCSHAPRAHAPRQRVCGPAKRGGRAHGRQVRAVRL